MDDLREGDEKAFSQIFRMLYPAMCFYALRYTGDQAAAEDVAEGALLKIWERHTNFYNYQVLRSFLYRVVHNDSVNWIKYRERRGAHEKEMALHAEFAEASVLENIVRAEVFNDVYAAFAKLPPRCRQIISMIFFEGKKTREVAEELDLSIGTVKTQKARGLMLMRNHLTVFIMLIMLTI